MSFENADVWTCLVQKRAALLNAVSTMTHPVEEVLLMRQQLPNRD